MFAADILMVFMDSLQEFNEQDWLTGGTKTYMGHQFDFRVLTFVLNFHHAQAYALILKKEFKTELYVGYVFHMSYT
jgi:hypothetical protein